MSDNTASPASGDGAEGAASAAPPRLAIHHPRTADFIKSLADTLAQQGIPQDDPPFSIRSFMTQASTVRLYGEAGDEYGKTLQEIMNIAECGRSMRSLLDGFRGSDPRTFSVPLSPAPERGGSGTRNGAGRGGRAPSPTISIASSTGTSSSGGGPTPKRQRAAASAPNDPPIGATPMGDDTHMACLGEGIANAIASRGDQAPAFTSNAEIEAEYFSPLLFETNAARRKLCAAVEQLGALLVDIPAEKILSISAKEFAEADLRDGADPAASFEECSELMERVVELFEEVRTCSANLRRACSKMMRIHILAHHTGGAGWNTVAQLCFRESWDRKMAAVQDGFKPLASWEEKVATAMRLCKQDKHLTKEGVPVGPVCPRLAKRLFPPSGAGSSSATGSGRPFGSANGRGGARGRGGGRGGRRQFRGKENSKSGRSAPASAAPAAPAAAAAAAAAGGQ